MANADDEFVFAPLGGLGEIGMNCALYGIGPKQRRKWSLVDLGVAFAGPDLPGVDLIMPDLGFIDRIRKDLLALIITHAHEDHIGAVAHLWPRLGCPVYATRFAAMLLETRRLNEPGAPKVPLNIVSAGARLDLGPVSVEYVAMSHSIPESCSLAIRTPLGTPISMAPAPTGRLRGDGAPVSSAGTAIAESTLGIPAMTPSGAKSRRFASPLAADAALRVDRQL